MSFKITTTDTAATKIQILLPCAQLNLFFDFDTIRKKSEVAP